ncbi:MAG: tyrosine-type recombinase/integrase [Anaerolineaceae bacterium]
MNATADINRENPTITDVMNAYLDSVTLSRSENTARTYHNGIDFFKSVLIDNDLNPDQSSIALLKEDAIVWLANSLKAFAPTTERLYLTSASGLYEYMAAENLVNINLPRIKLLIQQRARRPGQRLPQFPREAIEKVLGYVNNIINNVPEDTTEYLRSLRDRAFLIALADSGLRVHEACGLRRGDIDWNEGRAIIIGKGNRQAVVRFSTRALDALKLYLARRATLDGASGRPLQALPLFARHDKGAGRKIKPITTTTGRNIVAERVGEALGAAAVGSITPHSFRHYFVTVVLRASGNLKLAQELARHKNISVTQRYAHLSDDELDRGYWDIFEEK